MHDRRWWRRAFCLFAPLSLSTMAGMSIGGAIFIAGSAWSLARGWRQWGRRALVEVARGPWAWATFALFVSAFLSLLGAALFPPVGEPLTGFAELKKFHHFLYPPLIALAFLYTADEIERHPFWKFWGGMGIFCGILAVVQFFGAEIFPAPWLESRFFRAVGETGRFHAQGLMFFHLSFAACMTFVAVAGLARLLWPLRWDKAGTRFFWATVTLAGFAGVYFSFSRIALAGLVFVATVLGLLKRPLWGLIGFVLCVGIGTAAWFESSSLRDRFTQSRGSTIERELMWHAAWDMFRDRPLTGFGMGRSGHFTPIYAERILGTKTWFSSHAHNNVLDTLAAMGILGLLSYLFWWGVVLGSAFLSFREARDRWLPAAAFAGLLAFQVNGLTQVNFWDGKSQHTLMLWAGVVLALAVRRRRAQETGADNTSA